MKKNLMITAISAAAAASMSSCLNEADNNPKSIIDSDGHMFASRSNGSIDNNCTIAIPLSSDEEKYILAIDKLAKDILRYPEFAKDFAHNPQIYFSRYGYNGEIDIDDGLIKFLIAYSDEDIQNAIKKCDLMKLVDLCIEKGLVSNTKSKINYAEKLNLELNKLDNNLLIQPYSWFWFAEWLAVALVYFGGVASFSLSADSSYDASTEGIYASPRKDSPNLNLISLWNISQKNKDLKFLTTSQGKKVCYKILNVLKDLRPELFDTYSDEDLIIQIEATLNGTIF